MKHQLQRFIRSTYGEDLEAVSIHVPHIFIGPMCTWAPIYGSWSLYYYLKSNRFFYLNDVTLADEDTNSILADGDNRAILGNMAKQVTPPGAIWWPKLELMLVCCASGNVYEKSYNCKV